jgi:hypothetical protein
MFAKLLKLYTILLRVIYASYTVNFSYSLSYFNSLKSAYIFDLRYCIILSSDSIFAVYSISSFIYWLIWLRFCLIYYTVRTNSPDISWKLLIYKFKKMYYVKLFILVKNISTYTLNSICITSIFYSNSYTNTPQTLFKLFRSFISLIIIIWATLTLRILSMEGYITITPVTSSILTSNLSSIGYTN